MKRKIDTSKRIVVTGAAGFIGFHLCKRLLDNGVEVYGFDNMNNYYDPALKYARLEILKGYDNFSFAIGDLADEKAVEKIFADFKPDIFVNLAAQAGVRYSLENPKAYIDSNVVGFFNVLEASRKHGVSHLVYASSSSVYGNQEKTPFSVTDNVDNPVSLYAATKKTNELMAYTYSHLYGIPSTGLRFFTVYGPFGRPDMAYYSFTNRIFKGETIKVFNHGDLYRDFTYIDDIIEGVVNVIYRQPDADEKGVQHRVYNIGNNKPVNLLVFIETLEKVIGIEAKKEFLPMQKGDVYQTYADVSDLERDFGFRPDTPIEEGLKKFVEWYREYYNV
ncbi:MAG: SDR family NAD(P)-dependent oxidoreductase [Clostridia bacterium]|jgi:UDP-glucuronate 4-epimerase